MTPIARLLRDATAQIWPRNRQQEALFDLPERKAYSAIDHTSAVARCAQWLEDNGVIAQSSVAVVRPVRLSAAEARTLLRTPPSPGDSAIGVALDLQRLAPLVGASPKTLANTLSQFAQPHRLDHRWLLALARLRAEPMPLGLRFEERSQANVMALLARIAAHTAIAQPDAMDALLLFSLIALWQRRRPTAEVRANRDGTSTRRAAAKPLVRLTETLIQPKQALALLELRHAGIRTLAIEAALTRAHLVPHVDRHGAIPDSPRLLPMIADAMTDDAPHAEMLRFRIAVMRAWRDKSPWPDPPLSLAEHPYVIMTTALARQARGGGLSQAALADKWGTDWAGKAMLAPLIRHRMQKRATDGERGRLFRRMDQ